MECKNVKMVVWKEFNGFRATPESNYNARIMDRNKVYEFNHANNFNTFDDVADYLVEWFKIDKKNIINKVK